MTERTFDYRAKLDPRNKQYRVTAAPDLAGVPRYWTPGVVLDQGWEGACVGFGCTAEHLASPGRAGSKWGLSALGQQHHGNRVAHEVYRRAQQIDEWEGESYDGTSVRAGMLVGRERGWWSGFGWAFNMIELRAALEEGPVVVGVEWREDSYEAPGGIMRVTGRAVGGHCVLLTGYTPRHRKIGVPAYRIRNSWSERWGIRGSAYLGADDLDSILFQAGGEAAVAQGRAA